jgi:general secretion pathway protein E
MESTQEQAIAFLKGEMTAEERRAFEESLVHSPALRTEIERSRELLDLMEAANEQAAANRVDQQIQQAISRGASDIHVIPGKENTVVSLRVDGALREYETIPRDLSQSTVDRVKLLDVCSLTELHLPQEGRILRTQDEKEFDLRVTVLPTVLGERVTVRILSRPGDVIEMDRLGFSTEQREALRRITWRPNGFVVMAGPAGSGKTTTLYAILLDLQSPERSRANIMTVEEPVEYVLDGISQTRVNRRLGLTYTEALHAVFRSDLDVLMVADLPDRETAELALEMAATGHLILAQVTAKHTLAAIARLRDLGAGSFPIGQTLAGALSQRLVRRICLQCAAEDQPSPALLQRFGLTPADGPYRRGTGCEACRQTGYKGRIAFYEILEVDDRLRRLIAGDEPEEALWKEAFERKGGSLWHDARAKIREGATTVEEAARVLFDYPLPGRPDESGG